MVALILAAGYGTRLYPLTIDKPKALLEVGGKTILDRIAEKLESIESCTGVLVVTNDRFYSGFENWKKTKKVSLRVKIINDKTKSNETRLGAIGDINLVLSSENINDDLLIAGSDNLFEFDFRDFVKFGNAKRPYCSIVLLDVKDKGLARKYGICSLDNKGRVVDFEEKPSSPKTTLAATALYFIPKEKIPRIFAYMATGNPKDAPGNLMKWFAMEDKLFGYVISGAWYDIGDIDSLKKADEEFTRREG